MKIAVTAGYWSAGPPPGAAELFQAADRAGIDQIWTAEAYGSDAWTPLAWWGSRTSRIQLGTAVSQLSARPPVTLAMTAMTRSSKAGLPNSSAAWLAMVRITAISTSRSI